MNRYLSGRRRLAQWGLAALMAATLAACGGGGSDAPPPPPVDPNFALADGSVQVDATNARLVAQDDTSITLRGAVTDSLKTGSVIVSTLGDGALRRVTGVTNTADGVRYTTEQASLAEAFERFNLNFAEKLTPELLGSSTIDTGDPAVTLKWLTTANRTQTQRVGTAAVTAPALELSFSKWSIGSGIELDGSASFNLDPDLKVALEDVPGALLPTVTFEAKISTSYQHLLSMASQFGGTVSGDKDLEVPIGRIVLASPPVVIVPTLVIRAEASGTASGKFTTSHTASMGGSAAFTRNAAGEVSTSQTFAPAQEGEFETVEAALTAQVKPLAVAVEFRLYGVGGPKMDLASGLELSGAFERDGVTGAEGIRATGEAALDLLLGVGGKIGLVERLFAGAEGEFTLIEVPIRLLEESFEAFFPFSGDASIVVRDNGSVPDDIFEVSLDGIVLGRTSKGGSGQFRIGSLQPGPHTLEIRTVEDDAPPGTWEITLGNGVTFEDGTDRRSGGLALGSAETFTVIVPAL